jgi:hypothetical protein
MIPKISPEGTRECSPVNPPAPKLLPTPLSLSISPSWHSFTQTKSFTQAIPPPPPAHNLMLAHHHHRPHSLQPFFHHNASKPTTHDLVTILDRPLCKNPQARQRARQHWREQKPARNKYDFSERGAIHCAGLPIELGAHGQLKAAGGGYSDSCPKKAGRGRPGTMFGRANWEHCLTSF